VRVRDLASALSVASLGVGVGAYLYGGLFETRKIELVRRTLTLPDWAHDGLRVAVIADPHIRDDWSVEHTHRALELAYATKPDLTVLLGDYVSFWHPMAFAYVAAGFAPLADWNSPIVAVAGNHDYFAGEAAWLRPLFEDLNVTYLVNEVAEVAGVTCLGVDSLVKGEPDPHALLRQTDGGRGALMLWHEPDGVDTLPPGGPSLMLSGHTHGGQVSFLVRPADWFLRHGYVMGHYHRGASQIYVNRGFGTAGPPARIATPPEISRIVLTT
jgi:predicted MPP superfamily phosphohydrolase